MSNAARFTLPRGAMATEAAGNRHLRTLVTLIESLYRAMVACPLSVAHRVYFLRAITTYSYSYRLHEYLFPECAWRRRSRAAQSPWRINDEDARRQKVACMIELKITPNDAFYEKETEAVGVVAASNWAHGRIRPKERTISVRTRNSAEHKTV